MSIVIFAIYLVLFSFLITKIPFFKKSGLSTYWLIGLFVLKVVAGVAYGLFYSQPQYAAGSDTWRFFNASKSETDWMLRDPQGFIKDLFSYGYQQSGNLFNGWNSYWNDLKSNVIIKLMAVFNAMTLKNYYADIIFFNFLFFYGPVAIYRLAKEKIKAHRLVLIGFVFCIPSFLFWCSGLHKDGLIFSATALIVFYFDRWLREKRIRPAWIFIWIACSILIFSLRNFVVLLLLPALFTWFLCHRFPSKKMIAIVAVYGLCFGLFFIAPYINKGLDFPGYIISKQEEFKTLGGNSQLQLPPLEHSFQSFVAFLPAAIDIAFFRPHFIETNSIAYLLAIAENIILYSLLLIGAIKIFQKKKDSMSASAMAFVIFCYCFAISNLLLSGYTVTLTGAIVRYRSFVLPFLVVPLANLIHIKKSDN